MLQTLLMNTTLFMMCLKQPMAAQKPATEKAEMWMIMQDVAIVVNV